MGHSFEASGIKLALNFSPMKAAQLAMKPADPDINADETGLLFKIFAGYTRLF